MKRCVMIGLVAFIMLTGFRRANAQQNEIAQLLLNVEKLNQFKQILKDMQEGYRIVSTGYNAIKDISQGNFSLHKTFLDGLLEVSPAVKNYKRIAEIINMQKVLVGEYKTAFMRFKSSGNFTTAELNYLFNVYDNLLDQSARDLEELVMIVTAGELRMSDDERLTAIDNLFVSLQDKLSFLRSFNNSTAILSLSRSKEHRSINTIQKLYGVGSP